MKSHTEVRDAFIRFYRDRGHEQIEPARLVLPEDATTLFTSSGMQPLVPYLAGRETHPKGVRLVDVQPCIRTADIQDVGDNRHTTFFEMLGNWSLGDYFKEDQIDWMWTFLTKTLSLPIDKLYVTVFEGAGGVPRDEESADIWRKLGVGDDHIFYHGVSGNWWSRSGPPDAMPTGEIGGPSSEVYYDFGSGPHGGPESDENRFLEICNSVFIQYAKDEKGQLIPLPKNNVDFGGGLERTLAALNDNPDVFETDVFKPLIQEIEKTTGASYQNPETQHRIRIIADHMKAAVFLIKDGVKPSNKEHGYVLRRLLRRSAVQMYMLGSDVTAGFTDTIQKKIVQMYEPLYGISEKAHEKLIQDTIHTELNRFSQTLEKGIHRMERADVVDEIMAFDLYQSYGFPFEITKELSADKGIQLNRDVFEAHAQKHKELSRSASAGKFKGGLADSSDQVVKYHTATHLIHKALRDVLGETVRQEGSNITQERLRFDFSVDEKPTEEQIARVEDIVNEKIKESLPVRKIIMKKTDAERIGALFFFKEKYGDEVSVYSIGGDEGDPSGAYSKEFCGGPHVANTADIGKIEIFKIKKIGSRIMRLYAR